MHPTLVYAARLDTLAQKCWDKLASLVNFTWYFSGFVFMKRCFIKEWMVIDDYAMSQTIKILSTGDGNNIEYFIKLKIF